MPQLKGISPADELMSKKESGYIVLAAMFHCTREKFALTELGQSLTLGSSLGADGKA